MPKNFWTDFIKLYAPNKLASLYIVRDHLKDKKEVKKTKEEPAMPTVPMMK